MSDDYLKEIKKDIVVIGERLWQKNLVNGLNGNISRRVSEDAMALTATKVCLGLLLRSDVLCMKLNGEMIDDGQVSTERNLHADIYKSFSEVGAVIHTHTPYINGYFLANKVFEPRVIESKLFLARIEGIDQTTPSVTDTTPVLAALKSNNVVVLRNHGVLAVGKTLMDAFWLVQGVEEAIKVDVISRLYQGGMASGAQAQEKGPGKESVSTAKKYVLFSQEQIDEIVRLVNADEKMKELGQQTGMTFDLAVKLEESGTVYKFKFDNGRITGVGGDENAEFLITAPEKVWRAVFNQEIDPFVATTQKKMALHGDFGKISKWYAPCSRVFELWQQVPVG